MLIYQVFREIVCLVLQYLFLIKIILKHGVRLMEFVTFSLNYKRSPSKIWQKTARSLTALIILFMA